MKRTLVYNMRADARRQDLVPPWLGTRVSDDSKFVAKFVPLCHVCMSGNDYKSTLSIDFGVTNNLAGRQMCKYRIH